MTIHEFGQENKETIVLIHPACVKWDYFEYVASILSKNYHLVIPALPGFDFDTDSDFTSVEQIASDIAEWLLANNRPNIKAVYGCSMGGSIVLRMAIERKIQIEHAIMDGAITPYQLPWLLTRLIVLRDFLMLAVGKLGGEKLITKVFTTDEYSDEDMKYIADVMRHCSYKTLWRTFDSCNNYKMPSPMPLPTAKLYYWFAENEEKARKLDIRYISKNFSNCAFVRIPNLGHGGLAVLKPELFVQMLTECFG